MSGRFCCLPEPRHIRGLESTGFSALMSTGRGRAALGINGQKITTLPVFSQKRLTLFFVALDRDEFGLNSSELVHGDAPQQGV
jgi:hypothetical protein